MLWTEIRIILVIVALLTLPGWAMLALSGYWRKWEALQRWFLAVSLSIAFWPVLYYASRTVLPALQWGQNKLIALLVIFLAVCVWKLWRNWRDQFKLGQWGWLVLAVLAVILITRLTLAVRYPYPAWTDSLHHTLITQLTALGGQLPESLAPFADVPLTRYHLGLYALTAPLQLLAQVPSHTALLWMAQFLNGLCGVGIFLLLDRKASRLAAIIGMIAAGLWSFQPAWLFNWGRFSQLAAQTVLLTGALLLWEALEAWKQEGPQGRAAVWTPTIFSALSIAAVGLFHFRVAGYLLPLILVICLAAFTARDQTSQGRLRVVAGTAVIGLAALLLIAPAMLPALSEYLAPAPAALTQPEGQAAAAPIVDLNSLDYYAKFTWKTIYGLGVQKWVAGLAVAGLLLALIDRRLRRAALTLLFWLLALAAEGFLYRLNIPRLAFTNMTSIMLMAYLPAGLCIGWLAEALTYYVQKAFGLNLASFFLFLAVVVGYSASLDRMSGIEISRQFMTSADERAMQWIVANTEPTDSFAINSMLWNTDQAQGTDAGYWIPYFTERETNTGVMISDLGSQAAQQTEFTEDVIGLYEPQPDLAPLCSDGFDYIYSGKAVPYDGKDFDIDRLAKLPGTSLVFDQDGVQILRICQ